MKSDQGQHLSQLQQKSFSLTSQVPNQPQNETNTVNAPLIVVCLVLILVTIIITATLWPANDEDKSRRQRNYARVDDLYFPIQGIIITQDIITELRELSGPNERLARYLDTFLSMELRLTSLALGGCGVKSERPLEKGDLIVLKLHMLPDFPNQTDCTIYRVAWIRPPKHPEKDARFSAGLQLVEILTEDNKLALKKYLNYLLDEPAT